MVNTNFMDAEKDVQVGDTITLKINDKESDWVVVGVMEGRAGPGDSLHQLRLFQPADGQDGPGQLRCAS